MNLKIAFILIGYWSVWILILTIPDAVIGNPFGERGYSTNADLDTSDFTVEEIDGGGFFTGTLGVFATIGRFVLIVLFGLTTTLTGLSQVIVTTWSTGWTFLSIAFVVDAIWSG